MNKNIKIKVLTWMRDNSISSVLLYLFIIFIPVFFIESGFSNILFAWSTCVLLLTFIFAAVLLTAAGLHYFMAELLKKIGGKQ